MDENHLEGYIFRKDTVQLLDSVNMKAPGEEYLPLLIHLIPFMD